MQSIGFGLFYVLVVVVFVLLGRWMSSLGRLVRELEAEIKRMREYVKRERGGYRGNE